MDINEFPRGQLNPTILSCLVSGDKYGYEIIEEIKAKNPNYIIDNFTYSILEILDLRTPDVEVIRRETFWKDVLKSKEFGMNNN